MSSTTVEGLANCFIKVNRELGQKLSKEIIGARAGEKVHESLLSEHEQRFAYMISETVGAIFPTSHDWLRKQKLPEQKADTLLFRSNTTNTISSMYLYHCIRKLVQ